jgi:magnesium-transporting ATPase (P-type)
MWFVFMCGSEQLKCPTHYLKQATERAEARKILKLPDWAKEADVNGDGKLTRDEWEAAGKSDEEFDEHDEKHKGYLTKEEIGIPDPDAVYRSSLFQTAWFVESLLTQTLIIHIIRTNRIPFLQSWSSGALAATSLAIMIIGMWLPFIPFMRNALGFVELPVLFWPLLFLTLLCYIVLTQLVKTWLLKRGWIEEATMGKVKTEQT